MINTFTQTESFSQVVASLSYFSNRDGERSKFVSPMIFNVYEGQYYNPNYLYTFTIRFASEVSLSDSFKLTLKVLRKGIYAKHKILDHSFRYDTLSHFLSGDPLHKEFSSNENESIDYFTIFG